jgi:hypothetical protein
MQYLFVDDLTFSEADGFAVITLRLSGPAEGAFSVNFSTSGGFASSSNQVDFTATNGSVLFAAGDVVKTIQIPITNDAQQERQENFWLNLSLPAASQTLVTLSRTEIPVTLVDNDSTQGGTPIVSVREVTVDEATEPFARFVVVLDRPAAQTTSVAWQTVNGSAVAGADFTAASGTLTFLAGQTAGTVEVALTDDALAEGVEQFRLQLSTPAGLLLGASEAVATIGANDAPLSPKPMLFVDDLTVSEADGYAELALRLSAPSASPITVNYFTSNGFASSSNAVDYIAVNSALTFAPGQTVHVVKVPINTVDANAETQENFWLNLSLPAASQTLVTLSRTEIPVTLVDNDSTQGGTPIVSVREVTVDEATEPFARFVVVLDRPAAQMISVDWETVGVTTLAGVDHAQSSGTLVFLPGQTAQTIEVPLLDDALTEPEERFDLRLLQATGASLGSASATAMIVANDAPLSPKPILQAADVTVSEADGYAEIVLRLNAPSASPIAVSYSTTSVTATSSNSADFIGIDGTVTFAPGQTVHVVKVPINNDAVGENDETFNFNLSLPTASTNLVTLARTQIPVIIVDNDSGVRVLGNGPGDDTYLVTAANDRIIEGQGGGMDTVVTALNGYTLPAQVENLTLTGSADLNATGNPGNNIMRGNSGDNVFDGQGGIDTAVFASLLADCAIVPGPNGSLVFSSSADGADTLFNFERARFADTMLVIDTVPGGNTYAAYAMFNAGFNRGPTVDELSLWTAQLDRLGSTQDLAQEMINYYAPGVSNEALVAHLWATIIGTAIPPDALALYTGLLANGTYTQASLLELVAFLPENTVEIIDIVGRVLTLDPDYFMLPEG